MAPYQSGRHQSSAPSLRRSFCRRRRWHSLPDRYQETSASELCSEYTPVFAVASNIGDDMTDDRPDRCVDRSAFRIVNGSFQRRLITSRRRRQSSLLLSLYMPLLDPLL